MPSGPLSGVACCGGSVSILTNSREVSSTPTTGFKESKSSGSPKLSTILEAKKQQNDELMFVKRLGRAEFIAWFQLTCGSRKAGLMPSAKEPSLVTFGYDKHKQERLLADIKVWRYLAKKWRRP
jgi:hypothetical protein